MSYLLFILPAMLFALWAQFKVNSAYAGAQKLPAASGFSGAEAAARILAAQGLRRVNIEPVGGYLSDHYDPQTKTLRLSQEVYFGRSLAALGIAAHEAGHAMQDASGYAPLAIRNGIVPLAAVGSNLSFLLIFIGFMVGSLGLALFGIALFSLVVIFQLVNLPVEYNASNRAKDLLLRSGIIAPGESRAVARVLDAAALTYVAATLSAISTLVYYLIQLGVFGGLGHSESEG